MWQRVTGMLFFLMMAGNAASAQFFPTVKEKTSTTGAGVYKELDIPNSYLITIAHAREYQLRTWFTLGAEGVLYRYTAGKYSSIGATIRPVTRLFFNATPQLKVFAEAKGGVIFMIPEYPDKLVNYVFVGSAGVDWQYAKFSGVRVSAGYNHFSNGKRKGDAKNPTWDGLGLEVKYIHYLR